VLEDKVEGECFVGGQGRSVVLEGRGEGVLCWRTR
jgi:hypothetical protein